MHFSGRHPALLGAVVVAILMSACGDDDVVKPSCNTVYGICDQTTDTLLVRVAYSRGVDTTMTTVAARCGSCANATATLDCLKGYECAGFIASDCTDWQQKWPGLGCVPPDGGTIIVAWVAWKWDGSEWQRVESGTFSLVLRDA